MDKIHTSRYCGFAGSFLNNEPHVLYIVHTNSSEMNIFMKKLSNSENEGATDYRTEKMGCLPVLLKKWLRTTKQTIF